MEAMQTLNPADVWDMVQKAIVWLAGIGIVIDLTPGIKIQPVRWLINIFRLHNESLLNQAGRSCTAAVSCYIRGIDVFIIQYIRAGCKRKTRAGQCGKPHGAKNQKT